MAEQVARRLRSDGRNGAKDDRLADLAARCGQVHSDAWPPCRGVSAAPLSTYDIRDAWMAEGGYA